tara:strand:- start:202 stop:363 length:162 start_codon:yes stop_codon:yes gene_type:complete
MQLTQVLQLRNEFEFLTKNYNMPDGSDIDTIEWFLKNGHRSNFFVMDLKKLKK